MIRHNLRVAVAAALLASFLGACASPDGISEQVLIPREVAFEDLFVLEDTIRLDDSVLIGRIGMLDVNSVGELLVYDRQGEAVHAFSPVGVLLRTLAITDCNPEATFGFRAQARYLDDLHVMVLTTKGGMVFDDKGHCVQSSTDPFFVTRAYSVCAFRDTIFAKSQTRGDSIFIRAYSAELSLIDHFPLPAVRFPKRAGITHPNQGRTMACFADDIWWVYGEDFDARPRLDRRALTRYKPDFYRQRTQDYPDIPDVTPSNFQEVTAMLNEAEQEASAVTGVYVLDETTRIITYWGVDASGAAHSEGILVADHNGEFAGVSTRSHESLAAAGYGSIYITAEPEDQAGGAAANPPILRYRFIHPGE